MKSNAVIIEILQSFESILVFLESLLVADSENKAALKEANDQIDELENRLENTDEEFYQALLPSLERAKALNEKVLAVTAPAPIPSLPTESEQSNETTTEPEQSPEQPSEESSDTAPEQPSEDSSDTANETDDDDDDDLI